MVKEFFKQYPSAKLVLKVGDKLYLEQFESLAKKEAKSKGLEVEFIETPNKPKGDKLAKDA